MDGRTSVENPNYETFRDSVSQTLIHRSAQNPSKIPPRRQKKTSPLPADSGKPSLLELEANDPEDLAEFIDYIAGETFNSLPEEVQSLSYATIQGNSGLSGKYAEPLPLPALDSLTAAVPLSVSESLAVYGLIPDASEFPSFLNPILTGYIAAAVAGPPKWSATRASACEICDREWVPLTYHHLIPREVHDKALKRKWHDEWMLNSVAWLCRACHSFVHRMASNEELAKDWYTVERILQREDVQHWAQWVARIRWKAK
ncbi:uncharacterized protein PADG_08202 [Paracoccidioides brasiliensis Pb18]|uniref:HNH domain-containing protein n=2 Tax=Paracoccidioides brasiliensis TaxID=121759 RepID=C1GMB6_PARBD|nr:uncharacterized protein PADG_08202 [Paracoccidioides brasiliensis Pb18]EEH43582.1 hypothetical protein PADG_08202 [Paracoccidioides brasiliensis Pb18]ODH13912.1 hypothetical protein ACO22_06802 [Paracoccidioides brasiliensis]ODH45655.1 hypothetical protein GX48_08265 [Paracoccidioides brasiliensis]